VDAETVTRLLVPELKIPALPAFFFSFSASASSFFFSLSAFFSALAAAFASALSFFLSESILDYVVILILLSLPTVALLVKLRWTNPSCLLE
jgi:hypothetical protein